MSVSLAGRIRAALAGRYAIEKELGHGGMAVVYLARDVKHDRLVAVKVLRPEVSTTLGPDRFLQEITFAAQLAHPHIVPLHDSGEADGLLYYVMPFVEGETLRARLDREHRLDVAEAVALACEVADALDYAHRHGVVHRDIKPENILLVAGHAIVADFGIARAVRVAGSRITTAGFVLGTPEYMSPEQASGESGVDGRSDLYSLGCVVFEALTGHPPFGGDAQQVVAQHVGTPVEAIRKAAPGVPEAVAAAVERALAKAPEDRFTTVAAFAAALGGRAPSRRPPWRRRVLGGVAVAAVLGAAWWLSRVPTRAPASGPDPTHVAVLYFEDQSQPSRRIPEVASGLTEELIDQLGGVPALRVTSAAGVRPYREGVASLDSIARALDVGSIVTGAVTRSGNQLRVTVRLADPRTGAQLRSHTEERPWSDLLVVRDSIVEDVATMLRETLGREIRIQRQREGTSSVAAWRLVQQAEPLADVAAGRMRRGDLEAAADILARADSLVAAAGAADPAWLEPAVARARLAFTRAVLRWDEAMAGGHSADLLRPGSPAAAAFAADVARGVRFADAGLARHPGAAEALEVRGRLRYTLWSYFGRRQGDTLLTMAAADLQAAVLADTMRATAWFTLSELYRQLGRLDDADVAARAALAADAYFDQAPRVMSELFFSALSLEHWEDARSWCERGVRRFPHGTNFVDCRLRILGWTGAEARDVAVAWRESNEADRIDPSPVLMIDRRLLVAAILARSGMRDSARAVIQATRAGVKDPYLSVEMSYAQAYVSLLLGDRDDALDLLKRYLAANPQERRATAHHPWWRELRGDARFQALVRTDS